LPGARESMALLKQHNFLLILISNQPGIAHGLFTATVLNAMHAAIQKKLATLNASFDAMYYCPHYPEAKIKEFSIECNCRKPKPGLILRAAQDFNIHLASSWMIGDI